MARPDDRKLAVFIFCAKRGTAAQMAKNMAMQTDGLREPFIRPTPRPLLVFGLDVDRNGAKSDRDRSRVVRVAGARNHIRNRIDRADEVAKRGNEPTDRGEPKTRQKPRTASWGVRNAG